MSCISFYHPRAIILLLILCYFVQLRGQYSETLYGIDEGLSYPTVLDIAEDENGFIWVFTSYGVNRFDGFRFREYQDEESKYNRTISYQGWFLKDSRGRIWIESGTGIFVIDVEMDRVKKALPLLSHVIHDIEEDGDGDWIITNQLSFFKVKEKPGKQFDYQDIKLPEEAHIINYMLKLEDGSFLATCFNGLCKVTISGDSIQAEKIRVQHDNDKRYGINKDTRILTVGNDIYLVTQNTILKTSFNHHEITTDSLYSLTSLNLNFPEIGLSNDLPIATVINGRENEIFIRCQKGIYSYNLESKMATRIRVENYGYDTAEGNYLAALYYSSDGILWAGTDNGLLKIVIGNKPFQTLRPGTNDHYSPDAVKLRGVCVDSNQDLWVGTTSDGLYQFRKKTDGSYREINHYLPDPSDPYSIAGKYIGVLYEDASKRLWVGTGDAQWMDLNSPGKFHSTKATDYASQLGTDMNPIQILEDAMGNIIILCPSGLHWLLEPDLSEAYCLLRDTAKNQILYPTMELTGDNQLFMYDHMSFYKLSGEWERRINNPVASQGDSLWGWGGYYVSNERIPFVYPSDMKEYFNLMDSLIEFRTIFTITDSGQEKTIWLYMKNLKKILKIDLDDNNFSIDNTQKITTADFHLYPVEPDRMLGRGFEIVKDNSGRIWSSTSDGLLQIDPATNKSYLYYQDDGLPGNKFYWGACVDEEGIIYMCTVNGLVYFNPDSILPDPAPEVTFTDFRLFNETIRPDSGTYLSGSISNVNEIKLKHRQNFIGIGFTALNYRNTKKIQFSYMLEGLDHDWIPAGEKRLAEYTDLKSGRYTFRVIASSGNGIWNQEGASLFIRILPPFWLKSWVVILEVLLVLSIFILIVRNREKELRKRALALEEKVDEKTREVLEQRKEVDALKSRFYTNISHEFRTPLTLILGPLQDFMKRDGSDKTLTKDIVKIMMNNANRLQRLINQLLDISKIESGKMEIQLVRGDLGQFLRAIASSFHSMAESQNIQYTIQVDISHGEFSFDADKLEKVISNLLSNAFKFTPSGGKIEISCFLKQQEGGPVLKMEIRDTGKGIDADQADAIFDRFYQVTDNDSRDAEGSGIGLALTRELIELMNGTIHLESQMGEGSCFYVSIPIQVSQDEHTEIPLLDKEVYLPGHEVDDIEDKEVEEIYTQPATRDEIILIVEDNADLRQYIRQRISNGYRVLEAANGKEGLDMALLHIPDLVLTDIMMPEMDGTELCSKLKKNPLTDHIPVIMLTAKADKESLLGGFEVLADDYIVKPFDFEILNARIQNLLEQRNTLRESLRKEFMKENPSEKLMRQQKGFLDEFFVIIEAQMDDPELKVEQVALKMNMSRAQLFRKSQSVTACTPHELIRMFRMKEAAGLLKQGNLNVTQVMYQVGLRNLSHFAKSFKAYYGVNPAEYVSNKPK